MRTINFILLYFCLNTTLTGQVRRDALWCFGDSALIDFNHNPPVIDYCSTRSRGSSCSIADSSGNLLFYAHSFYYPVWLTGYNAVGVIKNKNHQVMEGGDSIYARTLYKEMLIIPDPGSWHRYYLVHTGVTDFPKIYYSTIDLSYNNGLGKVTQKNITIDSLPGRGLTDCIAAVKHGNGRDWWVVFKTVRSDFTPENRFYKILITPMGIQPATIQQIGNSTYTNILRFYFSNSGNQLALVDYLGLVELYDFDRCSGMLSNLRTLHNESTDTLYFIYNANWSASFSPNDSLLYVSTNDPSISYLHQYDLTAVNIPASRILVGTLSYPGNGGELKSAIDGKVYWSGIYDRQQSFPFPYPDSIYNQYNMYLSVIQQPNNPGIACDFQPNIFYLGGHRSYLGLPNNPNYDMFALGGSVCDTLGLPNGLERPEKDFDFITSPNPAQDYIDIECPFEFAGHLTITDITGRHVMAGTMRGSKHRINISTLPGGIYILNTYLNNRYLSSVKIMVLK